MEQGEALVVSKHTGGQSRRTGREGAWGVGVGFGLFVQPKEM